MKNNPYKQYQKTQIITASREKLLLMLYEAVIRFTKQAKVAIQNKNLSDKGKYIAKAMAILSELMGTLDFKSGQELARNLENLYIFMIDKLIEANINHSIENLDHVEKLLKTLYIAWKDVIEHPRENGVPSKALQPELYKKYTREQKETSSSKGENLDFQPLKISV